jgi:hypothetical protein
MQFKGSSALSVQINLASKDSTPWKDKGLRETELVGGGRNFLSWRLPGLTLLNSIDYSQKSREICTECAEDPI